MVRFMYQIEEHHLPSGICLQLLGIIGSKTRLSLSGSYVVVDKRAREQLWKLRVQESQSVQAQFNSFFLSKTIILWLS